MIKDLEKWRIEVQLAEDFRDKEFGQFTEDQISKAGHNIQYFDFGYGQITDDGTVNDYMTTTLNLFHAITKNVVPSLMYQNPKILAFPEKIESQDTAPIVSQTMNHFYRKIKAEDANERVVWDAYVLGYGISKVGYATKFGIDVKDDKKKPSLLDKALNAVGLKKLPEEPETHPEINYNIISENPYISYVSPFNFGIDPRATCLEDARFVYEKVKKTVKAMKANKRYKNTSKLTGTNPELPFTDTQKISVTEIEDFKTVDLFEIHYRDEEAVYLLVISRDGDVWEEHLHEKTIYEICGWQYEFLAFNKHGHKLYPISDMTKIRNLQNRFSSTIDSILEQVDRFVPKLAYVGGDVTEKGLNSLQNGDIGATVECTKDPNLVFKELNMTQVKADLLVLTDKVLDIISIQTGLTKAQLTGVSNSATATEATITQGGQTLRLSDMNKSVNKYLKNQSFKLWQIIKQFVDLEELQLINGISGIDEKTGLPKYSWLEIDNVTGQKMRTGEYEFDIEVGSTQKPDLAVVRKQFENMFNILARTDVITLMQQQGKKVDLAELLRLYIQLFPEMVKDVGRIIQNITPETTGLVDPMAMEAGPGGTTPGSNQNAMQSLMAGAVPSVPNQSGGYN